MNQQIFHYFAENHDLHLLESELNEIEHVVNEELKSRIAALESSLAELQRVIQVKDEALTFMIEHGTHLAVIGSQPVCPICVGEKALDATPKNLPKFVP